MTGKLKDVISGILYQAWIDGWELPFVILLLEIWIEIFEVGKSNRIAALTHIDTDTHPSIPYHIIAVRVDSRSTQRVQFVSGIHTPSDTMRLMLPLCDNVDQIELKVA